MNLIIHFVLCVLIADMLDEIASSLCASMNPTDLAVGDGHSIRTDASCNITVSAKMELTLHAPISTCALL